jgi:hypothetical protein
MAMEHYDPITIGEGSAAFIAGPPRMATAPSCKRLWNVTIKITE